MDNTNKDFFVFENNDELEQTKEFNYSSIGGLGESDYENEDLFNTEEVNLNFYNETPKSKLERIEECDLLRFIDKFKPVHMIEVEVNNISVDTPKDLEVARIKMKEYLKRESIL